MCQISQAWAHWHCSQRLHFHDAKGLITPDFLRAREIPTIPVNANGVACWRPSISLILLGYSGDVLLPWDVFVTAFVIQYRVGIRLTRRDECWMLHCHGKEGYLSCTSLLMQRLQEAPRQNLDAQHTSVLRTPIDLMPQCGHLSTLSVWLSPAWQGVTAVLVPLVF